MQLPLVPLRDVVIFPGVVTSLFVGRDKSIKSLQTAMESDKSVMLVAQKNSSQENPKVKDLYNVGSVSTILQLIKLPDGTYKVLVEGIKRAKILSVAENNGYIESEVEVLEDYELDDDNKGIRIHIEEAKGYDLEHQGKTKVIVKNAVGNIKIGEKPFKVIPKIGFDHFLKIYSFNENPA